MTTLFDSSRLQIGQVLRYLRTYRHPASHRMKPAYFRLFKRVGTIFFALVVLCAPLVMYVVKFGYVPSDDHKQWADFGSAMGGIYGPILTVMTLWLLVLQYRMQRQMNTQQANQLFLSKANEDIQTHLGIIAQAIEKKLVGMTDVRRLLLSNFEDATVEQLQTDAKRKLAYDVELSLPEIYLNWSAIYSSFAGLKTLEGTQHESHLVSIKFKLIGTLGFSMCRTLDNYLYAVTSGRIAYPYEFNPALPLGTTPFRP